jgi:DNA-binding response OmpR family regulator
LILIADDNEANREILGRLLQARGYDLVLANDVRRLSPAHGSKLPDLVLLDVMMPKMDGFEVCQRLKADRNLPFMPIILVTARADSKDVVRGLEAGGDEYVTKPIDQAALVARVRSALRIKELHDTVHEQSKTLAAQAGELAQWNTTLQQRVDDPVSRNRGVSAG